MSRILRNIKKYYQSMESKLPKQVTYADIYVSANSISLKTAEGIPSVIKIDFSGSCNIIMNTPKGVKSTASNRTILINNPFGRALNEILFYYDGNFALEHSIIVSFSGMQISGNVTDSSKIGDVNVSNLSVDLDDEIIYQPTSKKKKKLKSFGLSEVKYPEFNKEKQLYGKKELTNIETSILDMAINYDKSKPTIKETQKPTTDRPIKPEITQIENFNSIVDKFEIQQESFENERKIKREKKY